MTNKRPASVGTWLARLWELVPTRRFGIALALIALIAISIYVFAFTPYETFLFSDMNRFWRSALTRLNGEEFSDAQFIAWPPLYHIMLAEIFYALHVFELDSLIRVELPLTINIVAFAVSVYALHRLAVRWFKHPGFVLAAVLLYAFGFPSFYFNAFLLSGNLGGPLMVIAIAIVSCHHSWRSVLAGALLFGIAAAIRPSFAPYGLAFVAFYLARHGMNWKFIGRAAVFSAAFFTVVLLASLEVSRISQGKVFGLSANGGLDFFIANTDYHRVELRYDGWHFFVVVPSLSWKPEQGWFHTDVPFYEQGHYFKLGWEAIKRDPWHVLTNFGHMRNLFFADMLPSRYDAPGFGLLIPIWDVFKFVMFMTLGLYVWARRRLDEQEPLFWLMSSMIAVTLLVAFLFTGEPRYTYSIIFVFYLLFLKLIEVVVPDWRRWLRPLAIYLLVLLGGTGTVLAAMAWYAPDYPPTVQVLVQPPRGEDPALTPPIRRFVTGRVLFPFQEGDALKHVDDDMPPIPRPAHVRMRTRMEVLGTKKVNVEFDTHSAWSFQIAIDNQTKIHSSEPEYFKEQHVLVPLKPGIHDIDVTLNYYPRGGGFSVSYSYQGKSWLHRRILGVDSELIRFLPVNPHDP